MPHERIGITPDGRCQMNGAKFTTAPLRYPSCGQQTHKTLQTVIQYGGFVCECGARDVINSERVAEEIRTLPA